MKYAVILLSYIWIIGLPFPAQSEEPQVSPQKGEAVYKAHCVGCHGFQGKGDGPLIPKFPNPPSLTAKSIRKYSAGRIFHTITVGFGDMPGHAGQIYEKDRWHIVNYIKKVIQK